MNSGDQERRRKLNDEFDNVFREHERLRQDLNSDHSQQYQAVLNSIDKWEQDAIKKIQKTATTARKDAQQLLKDTSHQLQRALDDTVTEDLREALQKKDNFSEFHIDRWLAYLSEIRKQLETMASVVDFPHKKCIPLIKVKRKNSSSKFGQAIAHYYQFNFEKIRGHPIFYSTEHLITTGRPAVILSQNNYSKGSHYFRFRVEQTTDELFFGVISGHHDQRLKQNTHPIQSIHGWWNIDRRVIGGKKEPYISALNIYNGDEVILTLNCDARQIFLEYPSMSKINSLQFIDDILECSAPWRLLIEIGKPGKCMLRLLDWGKTAHGTNPSQRRLHCYCSSN